MATKLYELFSGWWPCQLFKNLRRFRDTLSLHPQGKWSLPLRWRLSVCLGKRPLSPRMETDCLSGKATTFPEDGDCLSGKVTTFPEDGHWVSLWESDHFPWGWRLSPWESDHFPWGWRQSVSLGKWSLSLRMETELLSGKVITFPEDGDWVSLWESDHFPWGWRMSVSQKRRRFLNSWHGYQPEKSSYNVNIMFRKIFTVTVRNYFHVGEIILEKLIVSLLLKKFSTFCGIRRFADVFLPPVPILS
jgi:hypothetical protein